MENLMNDYQKYIIFQTKWHMGNNERIIYKFNNSFGLSFIHWHEPQDYDFFLDALSKSKDMTNFGKGGDCEIILVKFDESEGYGLCYLEGDFKDARRHLCYEELPELFDKAIALDKDTEGSDEPIY